MKAINCEGEILEMKPDRTAVATLILSAIAALFSALAPYSVCEFCGVVMDGKNHVACVPEREGGQ